MTSRRHAIVSLLALATAPIVPRSIPSAYAAGENTVLLLASERMVDPRFRETVVLVQRHGRGGPVGVVLNRPSAHSQLDLLPQFPGLPHPERKVFLGGPVTPRGLYYIARVEVEPPEVLTIAPGVYMGLDLGRLAEMIAAGVEPSDLRIYAGYAGWAPGQLERELARQDWRLLPLDESVLFSDQPDGLYQRLLLRSQLIPA